MTRTREEILKKNARILLIFGMVVTSLGILHMVGVPQAIWMLVLPPISSHEALVTIRNLSMGPGAFTTVIGAFLCTISQAAGISTAVKTFRGK